MQKDLATTTPPIWQGRARGGESAAILGRNPDGTFQVSLNGIEKTFTEPNLAGMLNMRKGPLYQMLGQATQQQLAQPRTNTPSPPIWQGRAAHGENAAILGRNADGTFQVSLNGVEKTFKEPQVAAMTRLKKGPLYEMLGQATQKQRNQAQPENREMLESRWAPKVIPKGVSPEAVAEWRRHLESKRVANPVQVSELVHWQESGLEEGQSLAGEKVIERSVQSMLDLIPREVIERLGKLKLATVPSIPGGVMARFNPNTNTIEINQAEYSMWKDVDTRKIQRGVVAESMLAPYVREIMWHEMGHWLHAHASSHPRLWKWRRNLEQHWRERTEGERVLTHKDGWKFIRDHWIKSYVGRWYPSLGWGFELPTVYLEEMSHGPARIAQWCQNPHHVLTFKIVSSLFGPL